jgi:hypothetical protein
MKFKIPGRLFGIMLNSLKMRVLRISLKAINKNGLSNLDTTLLSECGIITRVRVWQEVSSKRGLVNK